MTSEKRGNRGLGFDRDVLFFAPLIQTIQMGGARTVRGIADLLNQSGEAGMYSETWSYGVTYRLLKRGADLGLLLPPQTKREAAVNRKRSQEN